MAGNNPSHVAVRILFLENTTTAPSTTATATPPPVQPAPIAAETDSPDDAGGISDEELAEAFAYAKSLKAKKAAAAVGK